MNAQLNIFVIVVAALMLSASIATTGLVPEAIGVALAGRIEQMQDRDQFECRGELICGIADLPMFYERNHFQPVWLDGQDAHPRIYDLLSAIRSSQQEGLNPENYHLDSIEAILYEIEDNSGISEPGNVETLVDLELLGTDAFLLLGSHLLGGRINPETLYAKWIVDDPQADLAGILQKAVDDDSVEASLKQLLPPHAGYAALKSELERYRRLASEDDPAPIPTGRAIYSGDRDARVPAIRRRLQMLGDLVDGQLEGDRFDEQLAAAVAGFQKRHGLKADSILGNQTLAAMNVSLETRIQQIELNLERWRWIPHDLGARHLLVNIADYSLTVVDAGWPVMEMRVVVGRNYRRTPVFSDTLKYIVINPYWYVPASIAVKDILPKIKKDKDYLRRNGFTLFAGWQKDAPQIDPADVDWSRITPADFRYRLRQDPGPKNALGRIKFMFPNRFTVYLHDTLSKRLFELNRRGFSSGCIRVERPIDLTEYVLAGGNDWNRERISRAMAGGKRMVLPLKAEVDIHILYWTAWVDGDGTLQFRNDIYQRDQPLAAALQERLPRTASGGHTNN